MRKEERSHDIAKRKYKATTCCVYLYKLDYNNITTATRSLGTSESEFNSRQMKGPMQEKRPLLVLCECASQKRNDHMLYDNRKFTSHRYYNITKTEHQQLHQSQQKTLHRCILTPNSSVFGHCVVFWLIRLNAFRLRRHSSIRRGPRTEHVRGLLQRRSIPDSLCWSVLHCVSNQPVHIWLPRSVARKNNHGLTRNPREPSDWQAVEGKKP